MKILKMNDPKFNLFPSPCQKSRLFKTICSLQVQAIRKNGHFLPVFCPYLEFSAWLSLVISASWGAPKVILQSFGLIAWPVII